MQDSRGWDFFFTDLPAVIERYGFDGMRAIFADNGIIVSEDRNRSPDRLRDGFGGQMMIPVVHRRVWLSR